MIEYHLGIKKGRKASIDFSQHSSPPPTHTLNPQCLAMGFSKIMNRENRFSKATSGGRQQEQVYIGRLIKKLTNIDLCVSVCVCVSDRPSPLDVFYLCVCMWPFRKPINQPIRVFYPSILLLYPVMLGQKYLPMQAVDTLSLNRCQILADLHQQQSPQSCLSRSF